MNHFCTLIKSRILFIIFFIIIASGFAMGQTTTTSTGGQKNTQANSAYVTPVVTKTYTPKADAYTWDNTKSNFSSNSSYTAPGGGSSSAGGNSGTSFNFRFSSRPKGLRAAMIKGRKQVIANKLDDQMSTLCESISIKVEELAQTYDSGNYFGANKLLRNIGDLYRDLAKVSNESFAATNSVENLQHPSRKVINIEKFYTLLTYNRTGLHTGVMREYLQYYTNCYNRDNIVCQKENFTQFKPVPPFANTCSIRDCPEKIWTLEELSMEAVFEIELAFTESAALLGYKDFAQKNFKSVMDYYAGKIQLSPFYLYLAGIVTAIDQHEYAASLIEQYTLAMGSSAEGKVELKLFYQKMAMFYFSKGNDTEGKKYIQQYYSIGPRTVQERLYTVNLLDNNRYANNRENKLITEYLEKETDSLLLEKEFIASDNSDNEYCLMLGRASRLYKSSKKYVEARKIMKLTYKVCPKDFSRREYNILRCMMGEADSVLAEMNESFYWKDAQGKPSPLTFGGMMGAQNYMEFMNEAGLYKESLEAFEYMKQCGIKKMNESMYNHLKDEALISYYYLKDYKNARKMMGKENKTSYRNLWYWAKLYAQEGNIARAKELYLKIGGTDFENEILIQGQ